MSASESDREARAARRRATWSFVLTDKDTPMPASATTPEERLAAVAQVTIDAWVFSGRPFPDYNRANMPGRVIRREREP